MNVRILGPSSCVFTSVVERDGTEESKENREHSVDNNRSDESVRKNPRNNELRNSVTPDVLVTAIRRKDKSVSTGGKFSQTEAVVG